MKEQPTGLADPDQRNKCSLGSVALPHRLPPPNIWENSQSPGQTEVRDHVIAKISLMLTVRRVFIELVKARSMGEQHERRLGLG